MGHTRKILSSQKIPTIPIFSSSKLVIELAENFHLHYRNYRLEMDHVEFELMARAFIKAYAHWCLRGCPESVTYEKRGDRNIFLATSQLPAMPSFANLETNIGSTRVELQEWMDYFHVHYKDFRLEFNREEYEAFSEVVSEGYEHFTANIGKNESDRRHSIHQSTVPKKVFEKNGKNKFWSLPSEIQSEKIFASTYKKEDLNKISERVTLGSDLIKVDIRDLFNATLYNTSKIGAWGLDSDAVFLPLKNRYEFVKFVVQNKFLITDAQIEKTAYYTLIRSQNIDAVPRDGSSQGIYAYPMEQTKYFISLIKNIYENGYNLTAKSKPDEKAGQPERVKMLDKIGSEYEQLRSASNCITVTFDSGAPRIANGLHRSAILYAMYEDGLLDDPFILVKLAKNEAKLSNCSFEMLASLEENSRVTSIYLRTPIFIKYFMRVFIVGLISPYFVIDKVLQRTRNLIFKISKIL